MRRSGYEKLADEAFRTTWMQVAEHPKRTVKMLIALGDAVEDLLRDYHVQYAQIEDMSRELATANEIIAEHALRPGEGILTEVVQLRIRLAGIVEIIEAVETRCMAADGPVTPTLREMTEDELRRIYTIANGVRVKRPAQSGNAVVASFVDPQGVILPRE